MGPTPRLSLPLFESLPHLNNNKSYEKRREVSEEYKGNDGEKESSPSSGPENCNLSLPTNQEAFLTNFDEKSRSKEKRKSIESIRRKELTHPSKTGHILILLHSLLPFNLRSSRFPFSAHFHDLLLMIFTELSLFRISFRTLFLQLFFSSKTLGALLASKASRIFLCSNNFEKVPFFQMRHLHLHVFLLLVFLPASLMAIECLNYRVAQGQPILKAERNVRCLIEQDKSETTIIAA